MSIIIENRDAKRVFHLMIVYILSCCAKAININQSDDINARLFILFVIDMPIYTYKLR